MIVFNTFIIFAFYCAARTFTADARREQSNIHCSETVFEIYYLLVLLRGRGDALLERLQVVCVDGVVVRGGVLHPVLQNSSCSPGTVAPPASPAGSRTRSRGSPRRSPSLDSAPAVQCNMLVCTTGRVAGGEGAEELPDALLLRVRDGEGGHAAVPHPQHHYQTGVNIGAMGRRVLNCAIDR